MARPLLLSLSRDGPSLSSRIGNLMMEENCLCQFLFSEKPLVLVILPDLIRLSCSHQELLTRCWEAFDTKIKAQQLSNKDVGN